MRGDHKVRAGRQVIRRSNDQVIKRRNDQALRRSGGGVIRRLFGDCGNHDVSKNTLSSVFYYC